MKISKAIRAGIKLDGKQLIGTLYESDENGNATGSCAIGAAKIGILGTINRDILEKNDSYDLFPGIHSIYDGRHIIFSEMANRNDSGETRKAIADWLESIGR